LTLGSLQISGDIAESALLTANYANYANLRARAIEAWPCGEMTLVWIFGGLELSERFDALVERH
jgi:hypothetical protein